MPNVWTHILFAEQVVAKAQYPLGDDLVKNALNLGAQGPDPFFYHRFWPWQKGEKASVIGDLIHHQQCGPFIIDMIQAGKKAQDPLLSAYIIGFVTHHLLDRNTHPYIIYRSGNEGNKHQKLEIIIDTLLLKEMKNLDAWRSPVAREIDVGSSLPASIESLLSELVERYFSEAHNKLPRDYISQSYKDMKRALTVLHDPYGWKNKLLSKQVSPFSYEKTFPKRDYLNRLKVNWNHPAVKDEMSTETFDELLKKAEDEAVPLVQQIYLYWTENQADVLDSIIKLVDNRSYDTGKSPELTLENHYFDPIL